MEDWALLLAKIACYAGAVAGGAFTASGVVAIAAFELAFAIAVLARLGMAVPKSYFAGAVTH